jgi:hypothetical protein
MKFKGMRSALLAVGTLAALTGAAFAQTIDEDAGEFNYQGQFVQDLAAPGSFVVNRVEGIGFMTSGALFEGLPAAEAKTGFTVSTSNYTFYLSNLNRNTTVGGNFAPGVDVDGTIGTGNFSVYTTFTGGTLTIYRDPNVAAEPSPPATGAPQSYRTDVANPNPRNVSTTSPNFVAGRPNFTDGTAVIIANIPYLRTVVNFQNFAPVGGQILAGSILVVTGGTGSIFNFLTVQNNLRSALITGQFNFQQAATGYSLRVDGSIDVIPEPTTMALFGAGLLPLGAFLRRRRGA